MRSLLSPLGPLSAVLCVMALATTGCQLRLRVDVDVDRNGGGVLAVAVSADEELIAAAEEAGADPLGDLAATGEGLGTGWRVRDGVGDDGGRTVTLTTAFDDPEQFADLTRQLSDALNADEVTLLEPLTLALTDDEIRLAGAASATPGAAVRDYGLSPRAAVRRIQRADAFDYQVGLTLPGEILSSTATSTEGSDLAWDIAPGQRVELAASGVRPGPPIARALAGAAAGALVAAVALWLVARRRRA